MYILKWIIKSGFLRHTNMIKNKYSLNFVMKLLLLSIGLTSFLTGNNTYGSPLKIGIGQFYNDTYSLEENRDKILSMTDRAKAAGCDIVVFHENALRDPDNSVSKNRFDAAIRSIMEKATLGDLSTALKRIKRKAKEHQITVVFGMPFLQGDQIRRNSAWVVGSDGKLLTRYDQVAVSNKLLFEPGSTAKTMWFRIKGAYATVSVGKDADYPELTLMAAVKGTQMHFHISNENSPNPEEGIIWKQKCLHLLAPANFGAIVNAGRSQREDVFIGSTASGGSMVTLVTGNRGRAEPGNVESYFPYTASIVSSAKGNEDIFYGTYTTSKSNRYERDRNNTRKRSRPEWYEWIKKGVQIVSPL